MITFGTIFSIAEGGIYPILNILLGNIAGAFVSFENSKKNVTLFSNITNKW
jgi:hypothetical protein